MKKLLVLTANLLLSFCSFAHPKGNIDPIKYYKEALESIEKMLNGEYDLSFRDAVFLTENAYLEGKLSYVDYMLNLYSIVQDVQIIRSQLELNYTHFDKHDVYTNAAIFQYFTDTLIYQDSSKNVIDYKYPYNYNFSDPLGENDWKNMFVSNLLEIGQGNCHSLPYLYQIIANEFDVNAHLVVAPNHLYITHLCHDPAITWYNTELTSATHPIDSWIMISTYMTMEAVRSGIYGLPLDEKQSIALTLVDLANGYIRKFPNADRAFAIECLDLALQHFPLCINAKLLKLNLLSKEYTKTKNQTIKKTMNELATQIHQLGYDEMPRQMYEDWLNGKRDYDPNYKPFSAFNEQKNKEYSDLTDKPLLTASNGRYLEYHWTDSLELIGNILYDTKHKEVVQILSIDTTDIVSRIPRDIASRWLSPDPLMYKYPNHTPYSFVMNDPINVIDPDGRDTFLVRRSNVIESLSKDDSQVFELTFFLIQNGKEIPLQITSDKKIVYMLNNSAHDNRDDNGLTQEKFYKLRYDKMKEHQNWENNIRVTEDGVFIHQAENIGWLQGCKGVCTEYSIDESWGFSTFRSNSEETLAQIRELHDTYKNQLTGDKFLLQITNNDASMESPPPPLYEYQWSIDPKKQTTPSTGHLPSGLYTPKNETKNENQ